MKKSLVALAALAATGAYAQSSVTISGIMDAGYQTGKQYGQNVNIVDQNAARTTSFNFIGVEDMGAGNKAKFRMEIQPLFIGNDGNAIKNAAGWGNASAANAVSQAGTAGFYQSGLTGKGEAYVGLESGMGEIRFGTNNSASLAAHSNASGQWGTGIGSGYGLTVGSTSSNTFTRFESTALYITPTVNGLTARYLTNFKNDSQYGSTTSGTVARRPAISELGLQYANGPLQLNVAMLQSKADPNSVTTAVVTNNFTPIANNINTKTTTVSASYDLSVARLGFSNSKIRNDASNDVSLGSTAIAANLTTTAGKTQTVANMLYAQIPMGQSRILLSTGNVSVDASPVPALIGQKTNVSGIAAEYDLSKRTFLYARYQAGKANAANCATTIVSGGAAGASCVSGASVTTGGSLAVPTFNLAAFGISHQF